MSVHTYVPEPPLTAFVELFWRYDGYHPPHAKERRLPTGTMELVINLREDTIPVYERDDPGQYQNHCGAVLSGTHSEHVVIDTASQASTLGVHFRPGGASPFLTCPAAELQNMTVSLETLWETTARTLREQLLAAESPEAQFQLLEQALLTRAKQPLERNPAVSYALNAFQQDAGARNVSDITAQIGLSHRRFIQIFREEVGLTPKLFCRIQRFQEALRRIEQKQEVDWINVALACGYYDQAHFIRDFRAFSGVPPTTYLAHRTEHRNHVRLPA